MKPIQNGLAFIMEMKKASVSCPESVRPAASMMVPEMMRGNFGSPESRKKFMYANTAALALSVSKTVSTKMICAPPSTNP